MNRQLIMIVILGSLFWSNILTMVSFVNANPLSEYKEEITFVKGTTGNDYKYTWLVSQRVFIGEYYVVYRNSYYWYEDNWTVGETITIVFDSLNLGYYNITAINYGTYTDIEGGIFQARTMILVHVIPPQTTSVSDSSLLTIISVLMIVIVSRRIRTKYL